MSEKNPYKTVSSKIVYQNPWINIHEDKTIRSDGVEGIYGYMESRDCVMVVVLNDQNEIFLVNTFSYPDKSWNWELPGGGGEGEETIEASKRELLEETGIQAEKWEFLNRTRVCNGLMTEHQVTYLARDLKLTNKKSQEDEILVSDGKFFSLSEVHEMMDSGEIDDNQSLNGIYAYERWLNKS